MNEDIAARIARGAEWLDEHKPGWERIVSLNDLQMESSCRCVLGQVFQQEAEEAEDNYCYVPGDTYAYGGFSYVLHNKASFGDHWSEAYGFDTYHSEWDELRDGWEALIKQRFEDGVLSDMRDA